MLRFLKNVVVITNLRIFISSSTSSNTFNVNVFKRFIPILLRCWCYDVASVSCSLTQMKWKLMKIFKVRKILIKSYVNLNRVKDVPIIHLPKAGLTIKSKLLMNLNFRNSDFLCKTRKSGIKCQSFIWIWWQCNACNSKPEMVTSISNWNMYSWAVCKFLVRCMKKCKYL